MFELKTERLRIIPLNIDQLKLYKDDHHKFEESLSLKLTEPVKYDNELEDELKGAWKFWIDGVEKNPFNYTWYTRWEIVLKEESRIVGTCGFKGMPDEKGEVEVGYMINPDYQNKGFMYEALKEMVRYAFLHYKVKAVIAETPKEHIQSQKVLIKNGFLKDEEKDNTFLWKLKRGDN